MLQRQSGGVLTVSTSPNFAAKWLVHRLGRFAEAHPEIDLRVSASLHHVDFAREDIDLAIRHGDGNESGLHVTRLCAEELFPVCSPKLLQGRSPLRKPSDLAGSRSCTSTIGRIGIEWLDFAGVKDVDLSRGPVLNQASMAIDAAVDGQGVALARTALAAWDLIGGRLVRPFDAGDAGVLRLLDRLPEGGGQVAENRGVQRVAAGRSCRGCAATRETEIEVARRQARPALTAFHCGRRLAGLEPAGGSIGTAHALCLAGKA